MVKGTGKTLAISATSTVSRLKSIAKKLLVSCTTAATFFQGSTTYYVDGAAGNDLNSGHTPALAWKTLTPVNAATFNPGDRIYFHGGQTFSGTLTIAQSGAAGNPIIFDSHAGGVATISSAANANGIVATNREYLTIRNLIVTGTSQTTNAADGVLIQNTQAGNTKLNDITLTNLNVSLYNQNGINVLGNAGTSGFNNVNISNCVAHDCAGGASAVGTSGITVGSPNTGYGSGITAPSHTNVTIIGCTAYNNIGAASQPNWTGSGITIFQTGIGLIHGCVAHDNGSLGLGSVGIWFADAIGVVIQFCEVYNQKSTLNDGGGYDMDGGCKNCVLQFNWSHDNNATGYLLYAYNDGIVTVWDNNICRFNISQNDGTSGSVTANNQGGITIQQDSATMTNAFVYGNTVFNNVSLSAFHVRNSMTGRVANNIFVAGASVGRVMYVENATSLVFTGNDYFTTGTFSINWAGTSYSTLAAWQAATGQEKIGGVNVGLNVDPLLINPGGGGTVGGYVPSALSAYMLQAGSPMRGAGLDLLAQFGIYPGATDYFGVAIPYGGVNFNVGAGSTAIPQTVSPTVTSAVAFAKAVGKKLAIACASAAAFATMKVKLMTIAVGCASAVSMTRATVHSLAVSCASAMSLVKSAGKKIAVACISSAAFVSGKAFLATVTVGCVSTVTAARTVGKAVSVSATSFASFAAVFIAGNAAKIRSLVVAISSGVMNVSMRKTRR